MVMTNVWVNGCFDILHYGHFQMLNYASTYGRLFVGIDSDRRVRSMKGPTRPFNDEHVRTYNLKSIKYVYDVIVFDTDTELKKAIRGFNCTTMVIGSDYKNKPIVGSELFENIIYFDRIPNFSTTSILENYV